MASPPQHPPATAPLPTATPAHPATASQPLPSAFLATSAPQRAAAASPPPAPLFTGRALHTNPRPASTSHGIIYPVATSSTAAANQRRAPHVAVGYPRANAVALPIAPSQQPQVPTQSRLPAAAPRSVVAGVTPSPRPELPPRGVPIAPQPQPEVNPVPAVALTPFPQPREQSNAQERGSTNEDSRTVVIHGRNVNLSDSESGSLYALCRSWVRNGVQHEIQPSFVGNVAPVLPRPLPASVVDSRMSGKDKEAENEEPKEKKNDTGEYTTAELLKELVDRAKKIRAEFRKERQSRIERYKQRLALLLPSTPLPPSEPGTHDRRP
ncbi:LIM domain-binding protein 3 [Brachypodium distachyon]|uniref:LIM domain-binding protein 3 n=1 Tax=Brachypodium distachyon TaxID=15368 RepID=UPI000234E061|nr:LIM domain-binding protein 3 [Brachypodium distachyon]|eukprot:XP_003561852.1 LIM domain-binding protein 3 [Brachypodium distachyon]